MTRTHHRLASLLACALLVLTACGGDPVAPPPLTLPASSSPTVSVSPQPESAQEFIRRWIETGDTMQVAGDTTDFEELSHPACSSCTAFANRVANTFGEGGYIKYGGTTVVWIKPKGRLVFDVRLRSGPTRYKESADAPPQRYRGGTVTNRLTLVRDGGGYLVADFSQLAGSAS